MTAISKTFSFTPSPKIAKKGLAAVKPVPTKISDRLATVSKGVLKFNALVEEGNLFVPLKPLARSLGLNPGYFDDLLARNKHIPFNTQLMKFTAAEVTFMSYAAQRPNTVAHPRVSGQRITCVQVQDLESLLSKVVVSRIKDPEAAKIIKALQVTIHGLIRAYFHDGGAINPEATKPQLEKLSAAAKKLIASKDAKLKLQASQLLELNSELDNKIELLNDKDEELKDTARKLTISRKKRRIAEDLAGELEADLEKATLSRKKLATRIRLMMEKADDDRAIIDNYELELDKAVADLEASEKRIETTEEELEAKTILVRKLRRRLNSVKQDLEKTKDDLSDLSSDAHEYIGNYFERAHEAAIALVSLGMELPKEVRTFLDITLRNATLVDERIKAAANQARADKGLDLDAV